MGWSFSIIVHENDVEDDAGRIYISMLYFKEKVEWVWEVFHLR